MCSVQITESVLKAAKLFVAPRSSGRDYLCVPYAYRLRGQNIVIATDGHTLFAARDPAGNGFPKRSKVLPDWEKLAAGWAAPPRRRGFSPVWANPLYIQRVTRAARLLGVSSIPVTTGATSDPLLFHLGADAFAAVMPMRQNDCPPVPAWLQEAVTTPAAKPSPKQKAKPQKKRRRR